QRCPVTGKVHTLFTTFSTAAAAGHFFQPSRVPCEVALSPRPASCAFLASLASHVAASRAPPRLAVPWLASPAVPELMGQARREGDQGNAISAGVCFRDAHSVRGRAPGALPRVGGESSV